MANYYASSVAYTAVTQFAISTAYSAGQIVRQLAAPSVGNERCFRCTTPGTSGGSESAWTLTKNGTTAQGTATFTECTGQETFQGTSWAAPFARLATAVSSSFSAAGDTIFVSADHAETQSTTLTITSAGTISSPQIIQCVARPSSAIPPVLVDISTGGSISTTSTARIDVSGNFYARGLTFSAGSASSGSTNTLNLGLANGNRQTYENCTFTSAGTSANISAVIIGPSGGNGSLTTWRNCTFKPALASGTIQLTAGFSWRGGSVSTVAPTALFAPVALVVAANCEVDSVDLSVLGGSSSLVSAALTATTSPQMRYTFTNCLLSAALSGAITGTVAAPGVSDVDITVSDGTANVKVREEHYRFEGSVIADTANYLTAGSSDGTTHRSWKMVSASGIALHGQLEAPDIYQWVSSTGAKQITLYIANTSGLTLTDIQMGFDISYLGASTSPVGTFASTAPAGGTSATNLASDTSPWTGLSSPTRQRITKNITINQVGWFRLRPWLRRASTTVWVDPMPTVV